MDPSPSPPLRAVGSRWTRSRSPSRPRGSVAVGALILCACGAEPPPPPPAPVLVTTAWLAENLGRSDLVLFHVGSDSSFAEQHIPGARPLAPAAFAPEVEGLTTELPDPMDFRRLLEEAGVTPDSRVVIYSATHPPQHAARLFLTLEHFGLAGNASLLDGGLRAWRGEERPVASGPPSPAEPGTLPPLLPQGELMMDRFQLSRRIAEGSAAVVDARDPGFWSGEEWLRTLARRPGRIPGARNLPFRSLVDDDGRILPPEELRALFEAAGVRAGDPVVAYCHVGQQASLVALAARLLGHEVHLYDGSWEEWSRVEDLPAEVDED